MFKLEIADKEYTLEITRRSIKRAEEVGIAITEAGIGAAYNVFYMGLLKHHPNIKKEEAFDLYDELLDTGDYDPVEISELLTEDIERALVKFENPNPKKKLR